MLKLSYMSIDDLLEKINPYYKILVFIFIAIIFFIFGRLSVLEERHEPIRILYGIDQSANVIQSTESNTASQNTEVVIGSKTGKKYYFPWCGTVKMIKPENQIKFSSIDEAKRAGFVAGGNCKGLR